MSPGPPRADNFYAQFLISALANTVSSPSFRLCGVHILSPGSSSRHLSHPSFFNGSATVGLLLFSLSHCWCFFLKSLCCLLCLLILPFPARNLLIKDYGECNLLCVSQAAAAAAAAPNVWRGIRTSCSPTPPIPSRSVKRSASQSLVAPALFSFLLAHVGFYGTEASGSFSLKGQESVCSPGQK